jgi:hypothetical protein
VKLVGKISQAVLDIKVIHWEIRNQVDWLLVCRYATIIIWTISLLKWVQSKPSWHLELKNICAGQTIDTKNLELASNEISSPAWAVYLLTEYAAATAGVFMGQLSPSGTRSRRPRLSNSSQFNTGPQLIRLPAISEKRLRYSVSKERTLSWKQEDSF